MPFFGCAICLNQYNADKDESIYAIHCGHVFHEICLRRWLKSQFDRFVMKSCPTCRQLVGESQMRRIYLDQSPTNTMESNDDEDDDEEEEEDSFDDDELIFDDVDTINVDAPTPAPANSEIEENFTQTRMALQRMRTKLDRMSEHLSSMLADMDLDQQRLEMIDQVLQNLLRRTQLNQ